MSTHNVLVIGATGKVGSEVINQLSTQENINVFAGLRSMARAEEFKSKGVTPVALDLDDADTIPGAVEGIDSLLLLTGYTVDMMKQSKRVIDAAKTAGVKHIVHIGASGNDTTEVSHWGWHKMIEAYIEQQGFDYTHLQPEAFMQNITAFGWLNPNGLVNLLKEAVWSWVDATDVGAIASAALARPEEFKNQVWRLGYDTGSIQHVADTLSKELALNLTTLPLDPNDFYAGVISQGADAAYMACIRDQFLLNGEGKIINADATFDKEAFKQATGRYPTTWTQFIEREKESLLRAVAQ
ncbi:NmrA family NAD(P)-binding protein [Marinibactrum halimedae]|uniref:NAD(P)-dependent oxidoreductase n=1 Tax=Marinibactrum halimedae TaxID=1444977 RepID=A0AA37WLV5_9GAMM|nr:NmrA family NAD(P)-binding protein [Marinibactrum halimedae]MCD9461156.1 NmrA family NAD(P)-binding protein [Marinibactrum halimedae]GLS26043.1 NAD(P)-dependent oxidoreductase [Marinibactrum halimedae]